MKAKVWGLRLWGIKTLEKKKKDKHTKLSKNIVKIKLKISKGFHDLKKCIYSSLVHRMGLQCHSVSMTSLKSSQNCNNVWASKRLSYFCMAKETTDKTKRQPTNWEKIFANHISNKGLISKPYKGLMQLNNNDWKQEKREPLKTVTGNVNWFVHYGKQDGNSSKNQE